MLKTSQGSCHCGAVRFEAEIDLMRDLMRGTLRCNRVTPPEQTRHL